MSDGTNELTIHEVDPHEAQRLLTQGALALDVREPEEFAAGHIPGAWLLPLGQLGRQVSTLPRNRRIVLVCRSGRRSGEATRTLMVAKFIGPVNLKGGMLAWRTAGLPIAA
ncbi:MAG: rhodanese-like domain-containing protein [Chloroflexi bacterium]|nr:rhodanese-like domain-containing protein [Chloroflexota bacterium]